MTYLSTKITNRKALNKILMEDPPYKHWREAWILFNHNQFKFSHELESWNNGKKTFRINTWPDMKLVVAYKYCLVRRFTKALQKIKEEAENRNWDIEAIDFSNKQ